MSPLVVYPSGEPCSSDRSLILTGNVSPLENWEILTRIKIRAGECHALNGRERRLGQQKDQRVCLLILPRRWSPEVVSLPWSLHLASAATPWEPQVWHLTLRFCPAIEKTPGFPHWCPHAPDRSGAHQLCSHSAPSASPTWSTPHWPPPCLLPNRHPSPLFSKTGIILHIFFPSPKIGKRREQLIWSSCWFCYLIKLFYSNSLFGFPSHLQSLANPPNTYTPFIKPPSLEFRECFFLSLPITGIHPTEGLCLSSAKSHAGIFTSCLVHIHSGSITAAFCELQHILPQAFWHPNLAFWEVWRVGRDDKNSQGQPRWTGKLWSDSHCFVNYHMPN